MGIPAWLKEDLRPAPDRLMGSLRITCSVLVVVVVMLTFRMPFLAIGPFLVFVLSQRDTLMTRAAGILMIIVVLISYFLVWGIAAWSWDVAWLRVGLWFVLFFFGYYFLRTLKEPHIVLGPLVILAMATYIFDEAPGPNIVISTMGWLWGIIGLVLAATFLVGWLLGAPEPRDVLRSDLRQIWVRTESAALARAFGRVVPAADQDKIEEGIALAAKSGSVRSLSKNQALRCQALLHALGALHSRILEVAGGSRDEWLEVARGVRSLRRIALRGGALEGVYEGGPARAELGALNATLAEDPLPSRRTKSRLLAEGAFEEPAYGDFALRATAATLFCYLLMSLSDWDGIHTAMITCVVTALTSLDQQIAKQNKRLAGAALGGILGIGAVVFLIPAMDSLVAFLGILASGTFLAAWVSLGPPRISYAGWQIALAFFMTVLQHPYPSTELDVIRDRWVGIALGIFSMRAVFVWFRSESSKVPVPPTEELKHS